MKKFLLFLLGLVLLAPSWVYATHLRYGYLSWAPTENPGEVEFRLINAFRREDPLYPTSYLGSAPDGYAQVGDIIVEHIGGTDFNFGDGDFTPTLEYVVTAYSITENYIICEALQPGTTTRGLRHTYAGIGPYTAGISSCCRIYDLNNRVSASYTAETVVYPLSGNHSPVSSLFPVITVPETNNVSFFVPAADLDGDTLRWRISTSAEAGGGSSPPNFSINPNNGLVTWNTVGLTVPNYSSKHWTVQVIIEDLDANGNVKTKTPVDFILKISNNPFNRPPVCNISPTGQINAYLGVPITFDVTGSDPDTNDFVTLNVGGLPLGAQMVPPLPLSGNTNQPVQSSFQWTPSGVQGGTYSLIFSAFDSEGFQGLASAIVSVSPVLIGGGQASVQSENCLATNGAVDPGEVVSVRFPIKNLGGLPTTNVVATLLPNGGITSPDGPQTYGAIPANGVASKAFTFRANGACGDTVIATLQLQEGIHNLGTLDFPIRFGSTLQAFSENFDTVTPPALPSGWTNFMQGVSTNWKTSPSVAHTLPNAVFAPNPDGVSLNDLISPAFFVPFTNGQLTFRHSYNTELNHDFCSVQIAIGDGPFTNLVAVGGSFATNGYIGQGWSGDSSGFVTTVVNLPPSAAAQNVKLRWRLTSDANVGGPGWYIDTISVAGGQSCCVKPDTLDLELTVLDSPDPITPGQTLSYSIMVQNHGPTNASNVVLTNLLPSSLTFFSASNSQGELLQHSNIFVCEFGTLASGSTASLTITGTQNAAGTITNQASVWASEYDYNHQNNVVNTPTVVALGISATNVSVVEGNTGTTNLVFYLTLSSESENTVSVQYSLLPFSASIGVDYLDASGTVFFFPGETVKPLVVNVVGDTLNEYDETILLTLHHPTNAAVVTAQPVGTIINDDFRPNPMLIPTLVAESYPPANGVVDPGETVTLSLAVKNASEGAAATTNLTVRLLAGGGVTQPNPSSAISYGVILPGNITTKTVTFKGNGSCGNTVNASFQIRDGSYTHNNNLLLSFELGKRVQTFSENFDEGSANFPPTWPTPIWIGQGAIPQQWIRSDNASDTPNYAMRSPPPNPPPQAASTNELTTPLIPITTTSARLFFKHSYGFTPGHDGGVLQLSIADGPFTDFLTAGGSFATNGYTGSTPLNGPCWTGSSPQFMTTAANFPPSAFGQNIRLRWRVTTDNTGGTQGWYVDTISILDGFVCAILPPALSVTTISSNNQFSISWPTNPPGFTVQYATNLAVPINWLAVTNAPVIVGTNYSLSNNLTGPQKYYRLRAP